jgi:signal recognition particle subunit SRP54
MTKAEREDPRLLNASRRKRIAAGSGQPVQKINQLIKRYEESRKMMKQMMNPKAAAKMSRMFGGFKGF